MAEILIENLTNVNGNGVFDKLSQAVLAKLEDQFAQSRITGTDYSKVFSTALDTLMAQSIQFTLQKDVSARQAELLAAQTTLAIAQEEAVRKDMLLTDATIIKIEKETELLDLQGDLIAAQTLLTRRNADKTLVEIEVLEVQKTKLTAEVDLTIAQTVQANKQVEVLNAQLLNIPKEGQLLDKQILKTDSETLFLEQRIKTEKAQIVDIIDGVTVAGVLGKQKFLYQAQTDGFKHDSEFKLVKAMMDTWSVRRSTDEGTLADNVNKLSDANIGSAVIKYMTSVGVVPV